MEANEYGNAVHTTADLEFALPFATKYNKLVVLYKVLVS